MNRRILAVVVALVLAAVGTVGVLVYVRTAESRAVAGKQAISVLVVDERIPAGTSGRTIRAKAMAKAVTMPASAVPSDALTELPEDLDGLVVTSDIAPRQLLLRGHFTGSAAITGGLALPPGTLAVSVTAKAPTDVAGFVVPGSKVAIFDTFSATSGSRLPTGEGLSRGEGKNQATRILLSGIEVIAVGNHGSGGQTTTGGSAAGEAAGDGASDTSQKKDEVTVTVAVTQAQAEKLVHATQTGAIYLGLLGADSKVKPGAGVDNNSLFQ
jgi:pilus assembly protein CpaB